MFALLVRLLVSLYPADWQRRYADELVVTAAELDAGHERSRVAMLAGILAGGIHAWTEAMSAGRRHHLVLSFGGVTLAALLAALVVMVSAGPPNGDPVLASARGDAPISGQQVQADVLRLCGPTLVGKRVTFVDMNPNTGRVLARATHTCR